MDRNPQIGEDYLERYLDIVGCRPVSEWLGLHIWLPRWGALGWCSSEFSSGSLSHSGCYTPTTRSMSTSLRSLPQQNKNQKFIWINLKCLAESKELAFDIHYAFFPLVRTERERENRMFSVAVAIYVRLLWLWRQWQNPSHSSQLKSLWLRNPLRLWTFNDSAFSSRCEK